MSVKKCPSAGTQEDLLKIPHISYNRLLITTEKNNFWLKSPFFASAGSNYYLCGLKNRLLIFMQSIIQ